MQCKQRYEENKEQISKQHKEYALKNKEKIKEAYDKWNISIECQCGGTYKRCHKKEHYKRHRFYKITVQQ